MDMGHKANYWDDGYPSGGNYWGDYSGNDIYSGSYQNETGSDGIGDTPYIIHGEKAAEDRYPFLEPLVIPEFPSLLILPLFMIATLLGVIVHRKRNIIS